MIELEELDDLYPDTEEESGSEETVIVSTEESSELASAVRTERTEGSGERIIRSFVGIFLKAIFLQ